MNLELKYSIFVLNKNNNKQEQIKYNIEIYLEKKKKSIKINQH
jgi:hypothetical protein